MKKWNELKKELLSDPLVKAEYDKLGPEYKLASSLIEARLANKMSQAELAEKVGVKQAYIARLESGTGNPTVSSLLRVTEALGKELYIGKKYISYSSKNKHSKKLKESYGL